MPRKRRRAPSTSSADGGDDNKSKGKRAKIKEDVELVEDLSKLTVKVLKSRLKKLGLGLGGRKADLVARLTEAVQKPPEAEPEVEPRAQPQAEPQAEPQVEPQDELQDEPQAEPERSKEGAASAKSEAANNTVGPQSTSVSENASDVFMEPVDKVGQDTDLPQILKSENAPLSATEIGQQQMGALQHDQKIQADGQTLSALDSSSLRIVEYKAARHIDENGLLRTSNLHAPNMLLKGHTAAVTTINFSEDGAFLVSAGFGKGETFLWDLESRPESPHTVGVYDGHKRAVLDTAFTLDGERLVTASADTTLCLWNLQTGQLTRRLKGHKSYANSCCTHQPGRSGKDYAMMNLLASCGDGGLVCLWDLRASKPAAVLEHEWPLLTCTFGRDGGNSLFTAGLDECIQQWDIRKGLSAPGSILRTYRGHRDTITGISLSPDGVSLLSNGMDNRLIQWDVRPYISSNRDRLVGEYLGGKHGFEKMMLRTAWSADGSSIACGSSDGILNVWSTETRQPVYALPGHHGSVLDVAFHPQQPILASSGVGGEIFLGELEL